jgi:hypothetical protein
MERTNNENNETKAAMKHVKWNNMLSASNEEDDGGEYDLYWNRFPEALTDFNRAMLDQNLVSKPPHI